MSDRVRDLLQTRDERTAGRLAFLLCLLVVRIPVVALESTLVRRDEVVENTAIELLHSVVPATNIGSLERARKIHLVRACESCASPRVERKFCVENAGLDAILFEEELDAVAPVGVVDKDQTFALDKLELQDDVE